MKKLLTILSALTVTTTIVPTIVACSKDGSKTNDKINEKEVKGEPIDIDKINLNMIINWKKEYTVNIEGEEKTIPASKLNTLDKHYIRNILNENLTNMIKTKINGLTKSLFKQIPEGKAEVSNSELKNYVIWNTFLISSYKIEADDERFHYVSPLEIEATDLNEEDANDKKIEISIALKKWDEFNSLIQKKLTENKEKTASMLAKTEEELKQDAKENWKDPEGPVPTEKEINPLAIL